jgi:hypothetical protein
MWRRNMAGEKNGSIIMAMLWMVVISLLLLWLPAIGPLIAGIVGGKVAGGISAGMMAALLPALVLSIALFATGTLLTGIPLIGAIAAGGTLLLIVVNIIPLLIGALIGGLLA